jgi:hypothetical protein
VKTIYIPRVTPSLNVTIRQHWAKRAREKEMWRRYLLVAMGPGEHPVYRRICITRIAAGKGLDPDNLAGGCKQLVDAIRDAGLIEDDDEASVSIEYVQRPPRDGEAKGTQIDFWTIEELRVAPGEYRLPEEK